MNWLKLRLVRVNLQDFKVLEINVVIEVFGAYVFIRESTANEP